MGKCKKKKSRNRNEKRKESIKYLCVSHYYLTWVFLIEYVYLLIIMIVLSSKLIGLDTECIHVKLLWLTWYSSTLYLGTSNIYWQMFVSRFGSSLWFSLSTTYTWSTKFSIKAVSLETLPFCNLTFIKIKPDLFYTQINSLLVRLD